VAGILEEIYDSLQDEIRGKNKKIALLKDREGEQQQEVADLKAEFQGEREQLLGDLRRANKDLQFYKQFVEKVVPCLR